MTRFSVLLSVLLVIAAAPIHAQSDTDMLGLPDQPGYVPNPAEEQLDVAFERQPVFYRTTEPPGTIVISTSQRFLYLVQGNNRAIRYGIGVGRVGFQWSGVHRISRKKEWPDWTPPPEFWERFAFYGIRWALVLSISERQSTVFTAPISRKPSVMRCRPAASV